MKARAIIHTINSEPIRTPDSIETLIRVMDRLPQGGTLQIKRLTDNGKIRECYIPAPTVMRLEEL